MRKDGSVKNLTQHFILTLSIFALILAAQIVTKNALAAPSAYLDFSLEDPNNTQPNEAFPPIQLPELPMTPVENTLASPPSILGNKLIPAENPVFPKNLRDLPKGIEQLIEAPLPQNLQVKPSLPTAPSKPLDVTLESLERDSLKEKPDRVIQTNQILVLKVVDYRDQEFLKIDSNSRMRLSEAILEAINHQVTLNFKIHMQLTESNRLFGIPYQRVRKDIEYHVQLYPYGVNRNFVLYNTRNGMKQSFRDLDAALETLSTIKDFPIAELSELHPRQNYTLKIRIHIDPWKLPAPLLLEALFTDKWDLDSKWFETTLTAPQSWQ